MKLKFRADNVKVFPLGYGVIELEINNPREVEILEKIARNIPTNHYLGILDDWVVEDYLENKKGGKK